MDKEAIKEVIVSQNKLFLRKTGLFGRDILADFHSKYGKLKEVIVITGVRRCGKSSLLRLIWDDCKDKENLTDDQLLYFNFEDERLVGFSKDDFSRLLEAFFELRKENSGRKLFLFLDEIQNILYWEKWINRIHEGGRFKVFITGSSSTLLSSEMASSLTGRNVPVWLYPLSFREYCVQYKGLKISADSFYDKEWQADANKNLTEYLKLGGMPEYIKTESMELIQEYFENIISRDIVNRYRIKYKQGIKELAHILLSNMGQTQSLSRLGKNIEIKNINTVRNYLKYLEDAFLFFHLPLFSYSYKRQLYNPDKYYTVDIGFFNNIAFKNSANLGSVYENTFFLELKRNSSNEIFYYKTRNNFEVDFAVKRKNEIKIYQVCYDLTGDKVVEREERAILAAMDELKIGFGVIINREMEETKEINGKKIFYYPLWKWLLEKPQKF